nr:hypothetical protein [Tanacetum cinerariifolium]
MSCVNCPVGQCPPDCIYLHVFPADPPVLEVKNDLNLFSLKVNHGGRFSYVYGPKRTRAPRRVYKCGNADCYVYGPKRTRAPRRVYKGGNADWFDDVDADGFSNIEVSCMLKELGYENPNIKILYKKPTPDLDKGLEPLSKDIDVLELLSYVNKFKLIELFIKYPVDKCVIDKSVIDLDQEDNSVIDGLESSNACLETNGCEALENDNAGLGTNEGEGIENDNAGLETQESEGIDNDNVKELDPLFSYPNTNHQMGQSSEHISSPHINAEGSDDNEESKDNKESKESEDSDFECDIDDTIDDPQVENNDQYVYEECDLEDFDSDIDPDDDEAGRKKALRKINTVTRILVEKRRELYLTKNDKEMVRAECKGLVPVFSNSGPSGESVPNVEGPSDGPCGSLSQPSGIDSNKKKTKKRGKPVVETLECHWLMHSVKPKGENTWYVRVFRDTHTCLQSRKVRKCTTSFLAREIKQSIKPNPKIPLLALKDQIKKKYEIGVLKQKVFRAKQMAQEKVIGDHTTQYSLLRQYVLELKERNPDTTVKIDVARNFEPDSPTRKPFPMQIITAVKVDPNNGIYPLAYAVVEFETKKSWLWFLDCIGEDLELFRNSNFTFVRDRKKRMGWNLEYLKPRPPKKRKKSAAELYDGMVKDGGQSTGTPMPNQGPSHFTQIPSQGIVNPSTPTINVSPSAQLNMTHSTPHVTVNPSAHSNVAQFTPPLSYSKATANRLSPAKKTNSREKRNVRE